MTVVDIHCHTFNADDLPIEGFVKRVVGSRMSLAKAVGWAVDKGIQGLAPGASELADLDRMLTHGFDPHEAAVEPTMSAVDADVEDLLAELTEADPTLVAAASAEAQIDAVESDDVPEEGLLDAGRALKRYFKWAALFGKSRLELTTALIGLYPDVDLFVPLLVDFQGLEDAPKTSMLMQLELQERISRLSLRGRLGATVLPFVGFDPRRAGALALAKEAVAEYGAIGVKLYPPMGFRPFGNRDDIPHRMTVDDALVADAALADLYDWCCDQHVPITAHSNPSNYAHKAFRTFSQPDNWKSVLERWPDLHLNLGHFGWGARSSGWPAQISEMTATFAGLYADIGNHDLQSLDDTMNELAVLFGGSATSTIRDRFMFGTDWFMVASHPDFEEFHDRVRSAFDARFPTATDRFMGDAALSFLGFDDALNKNSIRVRDRCAAIGTVAPDWVAR